MTLLFADPVELYVLAGAYNGMLKPGAGAGSFNIADRVATWGGRVQGYSYRALIDALGEGGDFTPSYLDSIINIFSANELVYAYHAFAFSAAEPATAFNKFGIITGTTFFNAWYFKLGIDSIVYLFDAANVQKAAGTKVLADNTKYHRLIEFDATNGTIKMWIGDDNGSNGLSDPSQWTGTPDLSYTDAAMNGTFDNFSLGFAALGKVNPATTYNLEGCTFSSDKPAKARSVWFHLPITGGTYEGAGTAWTNEAAGAATYASVDDAISGAADADTTYVVAKGTIAADSRWSARVETCAAVGMPSGHTVLHAFPMYRIRKNTATADLTSVNAFLRYNGTNTDDTTSPDSNTTYRQFWRLANFASPPGGGSWTQAIVDATEVGLMRVGTSSDPNNMEWRCTFAGLITVTEAADGQPTLKRSSAVPHMALGQTALRRRY